MELILKSSSQDIKLKEILMDTEKLVITRFFTGREVLIYYQQKICRPTHQHARTPFCML